MSSQVGPMGDQLGREFSDAVVLFHEMVAERLGLNATDFKCFGILKRSGPLSAGQLAEETGLTSGAITGVLNRLERAGFVRRQQDPTDRRRVIVHPIETDPVVDPVAPIFDLLRREMAAELAGRYSAGEWQVITDYIRRTAAVLRRVTLAMQQQSPGS